MEYVQTICFMNKQLAAQMAVCKSRLRITMNLAWRTKF